MVLTAISTHNSLSEQRAIFKVNIMVNGKTTQKSDDAMQRWLKKMAMVDFKKIATVCKVDSQFRC